MTRVTKKANGKHLANSRGIPYQSTKAWLFTHPFETLFFKGIKWDVHKPYLEQQVQQTGVSSGNAYPRPRRAEEPAAKMLKLNIRKYIWTQMQPTLSRSHYIQTDKSYRNES